MLSLQDWLTSGGRYLERSHSPELTPDVLANARSLMTAVNSFLMDLGWGKSLSVSSGFRPSGVNAATPGAAKRSAHMIGKAIDLLDDKEQTLAKLCAANPALLRKHSLFLEAPESTRGKHTNWVHLDMVQRSDRPSRIFKP